MAEWCSAKCGLSPCDQRRRSSSGAATFATTDVTTAAAAATTAAAAAPTAAAPHQRDGLCHQQLGATAVLTIAHRHSAHAVLRAQCRHLA